MIENYSISIDDGQLYLGERWVGFTHRNGERFERRIPQKKLKQFCDSTGYMRVNIGETSFRVHNLIAQIVLGKPLPEGAQVHHVDRNRKNNEYNNLVICQDQTYHALLHTRQDALESTGDPNMMKCHRCGEYDQTNQMIEQKGRSNNFRYSHRMKNKKCISFNHRPFK